ncbi:MAG: class I SAM-dependent methyltransferase, partial [Candidatus Omnitrophota bacterium]
YSLIVSIVSPMESVIATICNAGLKRDGQSASSPMVSLLLLFKDRFLGWQKSYGFSGIREGDVEAGEKIFAADKIEANAQTGGEAYGGFESNITYSYRESVQIDGDNATIADSYVYFLALLIGNSSSCGIIYGKDRKRSATVHIAFGRNPNVFPCMLDLYGYNGPLKNIGEGYFLHIKTDSRSSFLGMGVPMGETLYFFLNPFSILVIFDSLTGKTLWLAISTYSPPYLLIRNLKFFASHFWSSILFILIPPAYKYTLSSPISQEFNFGARRCSLPVDTRLKDDARLTIPIKKVLVVDDEKSWCFAARMVSRDLHIKQKALEAASSPVKKTETETVSSLIEKLFLSQSGHWVNLAASPVDSHSGLSSDLELKLSWDELSKLSYKIINTHTPTGKNLKRIIADSPSEKGRLGFGKETFFKITSPLWPDTKICDLGCNRGNDGLYLIKTFEGIFYIGIDISLELMFDFANNPPDHTQPWPLNCRFDRILVFAPTGGILLEWYSSERDFITERQACLRNSFDHLNEQGLIIAHFGEFIDHAYRENRHFGNSYGSLVDYSELFEPLLEIWILKRSKDGGDASAFIIYKKRLIGNERPAASSVMESGRKNHKSGRKEDEIQWIDSPSLFPEEKIAVAGSEVFVFTQAYLPYR